MRIYTLALSVVAHLLVLAGIVGLPHVGFVRKPFESHTLIAAIESVTDSTARAL